MRVQEVGKISEFLSRHVDETRGLMDWCALVNERKIIRRRLSRYQFSHLLHRRIKDKTLEVEQTTSPRQYTFHEMQHQSI